MVTRSILSLDVNPSGHQDSDIMAEAKLSDFVADFVLQDKAYQEAVDSIGEARSTCKAVRSKIVFNV